MLQKTKIEKEKRMIEDALESMPRTYEKIELKIRTVSGMDYKKIVTVRTDFSNDFKNILELIKKRKHLSVENMIISTDCIESIEVIFTEKEKVILTDSKLLEICEMEWEFNGFDTAEKYYYNPLRMTA